MTNLKLFALLPFVLMLLLPSSIAITISTDFSDTTANKAYYEVYAGATYSCPGTPPAMGTILATSTEFTSASSANAYSNISSPNQVWAYLVPPSLNNYDPSHVFHMKVNLSAVGAVANLNWLNYTYTGRQTVCNGGGDNGGCCFIANWTSQTFQNINTLTTTNANYTQGFTSSGSIQDLVNATDGRVVVVCGCDNGDAVGLDGIESDFFRITYDYTVPPPSYTNVVKNPNTNFTQDNVQYNATWSSTSGLSGYIFSINQTGTWSNSSFSAFTPSNNISTNITRITASAGTVVQWRFYANSSSNQWNWTDVQSFVVSSTGFVVTNPPSGYSFRLESDASKDVTLVGQSEPVAVLIGSGSTLGNYSGFVTFDFGQDIDASGLVVNISWTSAKSLLHNSSVIAGYVNASLLIPRVSYSGRVYVCPNAVSMANITPDCPGAVHLSVGESAGGMYVSTATYDGESYYLVSGITGTGGGESNETLNCFFYAGASCPAGAIKIIGAQNDSGGYTNAHAQNYTVGTYANSLCCNTTNPGINLTNSCSEATMFRLSDEDNAHLQTGNNTDYPVQACLSSDYKTVSCTFPTTGCAEGYSCVASLASSEGANDTNAHIGLCNDYSQKVCCGFTNNAPSRPLLVYPADGNLTVFERTPNTNWTGGVDPDGDSVTFNVNISCGSLCPAYCTDVYQTGISSKDYTVPSALCVDYTYNWTSEACDVYGACNLSNESTFKIQSVAEIVLLVDAVAFGSVSPGQNLDTTTDSPPPFLARNTGNVILNVTTNATSLFSVVGLDNYEYQYSADLAEAGSYLAGCSQTTFTNFTALPKNLWCNFTYVDTSDEAQLEINVTIPLGEPAGDKQSTVQLDIISVET